jgi:16S rRNA (adenine1518-N6/adenine1519-N6)-dimethyltransferase
VIAIDPFPPDRRLPQEQACTLEQLLRRAFAARRKMLRNSLAGVLPEEQLVQLASEAGVSLQARPQDLSLQQWVGLATGLNRAPVSGGQAPLPHG